MGEISELIQEGVLCKECGCLIEDLIQEGTSELKEGPGYPRMCEDCKSELKEERKNFNEYKHKQDSHKRL